MSRTRGSLGKSSDPRGSAAAVKSRSKKNDSVNEESRKKLREIYDEVKKVQIEHLQSLYPSVEISDLPDYWSTRDKANFVHVTNNKLGVVYRGSSKDLKDAASVRTSKPIPEKCLLYYFEIRIINKGRNGYMGIGLSADGVNLQRLPGWDKQSYGYHGDDGHSFNESGTGQKYGPTFTTGDIIGCGVNFVDRTCFYTKNGLNLGIAFTDLIQVPLYPTVGLQTAGEEIEANFGKSPFVYEIDQDKMALRKGITEQVKMFGVNHSDWQATLHHLVKTWLVHNGYWATAQKFISSTGQQMGESIKSIKQRYKIQQCILSGKISEAISLVQKNYPYVFERNPNLLFVLKCRHFLEFVHGNDVISSSDSIPDSGKKRARTSKRLSQQSDDAGSQDEGNKSVDESENGTVAGSSTSASTGSQSASAVTASNNDDSTQNGKTISDKEVHTIINLGRELNKFSRELKEKSTDEQQTQNEKMLKETFKVMPFINPKATEITDYYLLDREVICTQLNNEIVRLMKLEEDENPEYNVPIEVVFKHLKMLLREKNLDSGIWMLDGI